MLHDKIFTMDKRCGIIVNMGKSVDTTIVILFYFIEETFVSNVEE